MSKLSINPKGLLDSSLSLPMDALSTLVQDYIRSVVSVYQCSQDMVIAGAFAVAGAAVGTRLLIDDGKHKNYPCLWVCNVAPSGSNKSTPQRLLLQPLRDVDAKAYDHFREDLKSWKAKGDEKVDKPIFRQHVISDSTPEARTQILMINKQGVILCMDEIRTFLDNLCRYTKSGELSQFLSIYDHDNLTVNRKGDDPVVIKDPFIAMLGGIQPSILSDTFGNDLMMSNGFNSRWLFVYPEETPPAMYSEEIMPVSVENSWISGIKNLLIYDFSIDGGKMYLRGEAKKRYIKFFNDLNPLIEEADEYMKSVYAKMRIHAIRWAGIAHILGNNPRLMDITPEEMDYSCRCMDYFMRCAEKVYMKLLEGRKRQPESKPMGNEEMIANVYHMTNPVSQSSFANALGVSKQFISKCLKKYPKFTSRRFTNIEEVDKEEDTIEDVSTI